MSCIHENGKLVKNGFPAFVVGECDACGARTMYSNVRMLDRPAYTQVYPGDGTAVTLRKEVTEHEPQPNA